MSPNMVICQARLLRSTGNRSVWMGFYPSLYEVTSLPSTSAKLGNMLGAVNIFSNSKITWVYEALHVDCSLPSPLTSPHLRPMVFPF